MTFTGSTGRECAAAGGSAGGAGAARDVTDGPGVSATRAGHSERSAGCSSARDSGHSPRDQHRSEHVMSRAPPALPPHHLQLFFFFVNVPAPLALSARELAAVKSCHITAT